MKKELIQTTFLLLTLIVCMILFFVFKTNEISKRKPGNTILNFQNNQLKEITLLSKDNKLIILKKDPKENGKWKVHYKDQFTFNIDSAQFEALLKALNDLEITKTIETKNLKNFGILDENAFWYQILIKQEDKPTYLRLYKGDENPANTGIYLKKNGDDDIFLVPKQNIEAIHLSLSNLIDKNILPFTQEEVEKIEIKNDQEQFSFERTNELIQEIKDKDFPKDFPKDLNLPQNIKISLENNKFILKQKLTPEEEKQLLEISNNKTYQQVIADLILSNRETKWKIISTPITKNKIPSIKSWISDFFNIKATEFILPEDKFTFSNSTKTLDLIIYLKDNKEIKIKLYLINKRCYLKIEQDLITYEISDYLFDHLHKYKKDFLVEDIKIN